MLFLSRTKGKDCSLHGFTANLRHRERIAADCDGYCVRGPRIEGVRPLLNSGVQLRANRPGAACRSHLGWIAGLGHGGADQLRPRERIDVSRCGLCPEEGYAFQPSMRPDEQSFRKIVELLVEYQLPSGELPLFVSEKPDEYPGRYEKTVFLTAFQAALHADIPDAGLQFVTQRSLRFLLKERSSDGLWRFFGRDSNIDADIDDTFAALCAFRNDATVRASLPGILCHLRRLQDRSGLFRTWFTRANSECDLTVNANLFMFLSFLGADFSVREELLSAVIRNMHFGELPVSRYYLSPTPLQFSLSNCMPASEVNAVMPPTYARDIAGTKSWFVQNSRRLFYGSPVLNAIYTIYDWYYQWTSIDN